MSSSRSRPRTRRYSRRWGPNNVDVAWLSPLAYLLAHERVGADVLVANVQGGSITSAGQILVRADSGITILEGLRGKRFAFADDASVTAYHLPAALFWAQGLDPGVHFAETVFSGGDDLVAMAVYNRQVVGGAVRGDSLPGVAGSSATARAPLQPLPPDLAEQVRVIARTDPIPNDVAGIRKGIPLELGRKIRDGLLRVAATPAGATALRERYKVEGLGPVTAADFAPLRAAVRLLDLNLDAELVPRSAHASR